MRSNSAINYSVCWRDGLQFARGWGLVSLKYVKGVRSMLCGDIRPSRDSFLGKIRLNVWDEES